MDFQIFMKVSQRKFPMRWKERKGVDHRALYLGFCCSSAWLLVAKGDRGSSLRRSSLFLLVSGNKTNKTKEVVSMGYLNFENFQILTNKLKSKDDLEVVEMCVDSFVSYVKDVDMGEQQIRTAYATMEGEELRNRVMVIDGRRRARHQDAITSANILNRMAVSNGVQVIYNGQSGDGDELHNFEVRESVAEFCKEITTAIFDNRR